MVFCLVMCQTHPCQTAAVTWGLTTPQILRAIPPKLKKILILTFFWADLYLATIGRCSSPELGTTPWSRHYCFHPSEPSKISLLDFDFQRQARTRVCSRDFPGNHGFSRENSREQKIDGISREIPGKFPGFCSFSRFPGNEKSGKLQTLIETATYCGT